MPLASRQFAFIPLGQSSVIIDTNSDALFLVTESSGLVCLSSLWGQNCLVILQSVFPPICYLRYRLSFAEVWVAHETSKSNANSSNLNRPYDPLYLWIEKLKGHYGGTALSVNIHSSCQNSLKSKPVQGFFERRQLFLENILVIQRSSWFRTICVKLNRFSTLSHSVLYWRSCNKTEKV